MILGGSAGELEAINSDEQIHNIKSVSFLSRDTISSDNINVGTCLSDSDRTKHQAAVKLQKTYKSFRTRRQLADCAVLVEQRWWKLLDFVELKHSSISFFDIHQPETAVSRWSRARTKASKVGKGLSKDDKARKLALQHWLEAIDPRHRYGHNLQFYYIKWLHCDSTQPFFYWLDIGDGREVSLERCTRSKLHQQCIKYLGPGERSAYEVVITDGKFMYKQSGELLDTMGGPDDVKWIFVLSVSKVLYVGQKKKGTFQHSSFLAGGATLSAGRLEVENGVLKAVWPHSGHYLPTEENFQEFVAFMRQHDVDLTVVQRAPSEEDELFHSRLPISLSMPELRQATDISAGEDSENNQQKPKNDENTHIHHHHHHHQPISRWSRKLQSKIALLQIPKGQDVFEMFVTPRPWSRAHSFDDDSESDDGYETPDEYLSDSEFSVSKHNLFDRDEGGGGGGGEEEYEEEAEIPKEVILRRINTHKGMKSYQLAHQLSCKWTTGAGPRIGCLRDYPSKLQFRVLEDASLSPRSVQCSRTRTSMKNPNLTSYCRDKSPLAAADSSDVAAQNVIRSLSDC